MLTTAVLNGESLAEAGPDYFEATCIIEGYEVEGCADARRQGVLNGAFPVDMSEPT